MTRSVQSGGMLTMIRLLHTAVFFVELSSIGWLLVTGLTGRRDRTVALAASLVAAESVVFIANGGVCPMTTQAERLGATRGSVSDIYLPDAVARTIPIWSTALIALAGLLHARRPVHEQRRDPQQGTRAPAPSWRHARSRP